MARRNLLVASLGLLLVGLLIWGGPSPSAVAHGSDSPAAGRAYRCPMMGSGYVPGIGMMPLMGYAPSGMGMMGNMMGMMPMMGSGMMGGMPMMGMMGPGMMERMSGMMGMGAMNPAFAPAGLTEPVSPEQAVWAVKGLPLVWSDPDLGVAKVLEFTNHFYVLVAKRSTGTAALELLVDRYSGSVKGSPTMAWNAEYTQGPMGQGMRGSGMMGQGQAPGSGMGMMGQMMEPQSRLQLAVPLEQARQLAQQFLQRQLPGMELGEAWSLPGYYTLVIERDGRTFGLLSVNGATGQVWFQSWHGGFIAERTLR